MSDTINNYILAMIIQFFRILFLVIRVSNLKEEVRQLKRVLNSEVKDGRVWI